MEYIITRKEENVKIVLYNKGYILLYMVTVGIIVGIVLLIMILRQVSMSEAEKNERRIQKQFDRIEAYKLKQYYKEEAAKKNAQ